MKILKTLSVIVIAVFIVAGIAQAKQLWEYNLTHSERAEIALRGGVISNLSEYKQSDNLDQNLGILKVLHNQELPQETMLGGATGSSALPQVIADFEDSLAATITNTATSLTLVTGTSDDGDDLAGWYGLTLDAGSSNREYVIATCTATACTSLVRGVSTEDGQTSTAALKKSHRRGATVRITNFPNLAIISRILQGADGIPDKLYYDSSPSITADVDIATKLYVDNVAISGGATSTESTLGFTKLATRLQMASGTWDGLIPLALYSRYASSTLDVATTTVVITKNNGKINQIKLDLTEDFAFSGDNSLTGSTTITELTAPSTTVTTLYIGGTSTADLINGGAVSALHYHTNYIRATTSANLQLSADTATTTEQTSLTKLKEMQTFITGEFRIDFDCRNVASSNDSSAQIFKNGVAVGTLRVCADGGGSSWSENIVAWSPGDLIQLYAMHNTGTATEVTNFRLYYDVQESTELTKVVADTY